MRTAPVIMPSSARRYWRALAIGLSVTAIGLNGWLQSTSWRPAAQESKPSAATHSPRQAQPAAAATEAARPSATQERGDDERGDVDVCATLARRFSEGADADLSALAEALATQGGARAHAVLFSAARSSRVSTRVAALEALSTVDTADVREFMLAELAEPEPALAVIGYFADCLEPRAVPLLERLVQTAPLPVRGTAISSLFAQGIAANPAIARLLRGDDELSDALLEAAPVTADARRAMRRVSVERLRAGAITTGRVFDFLELDLSSEAREALLQAARDPASVDRALAALSNRGDRASLNALRTLAKDSDRGLSARAACALQAQAESRSPEAAGRLALKGT